MNRKSDDMAQIRNEISESWERYNILIVERLHAMRASQAFQAVQKFWLKYLKRRNRPFPTIGHLVHRETRWRLEANEDYWNMESDVAELGLKYGLAHWQVKWTLLVRNLDPLDPGSTDYLFPIDYWYPTARLIITSLYDGEDITLGSLGAQVGMFLELDISSNELTETSQDGSGRFRVKIEIPIE